MTPIERQLSAQFGEIDVDGSAWAEHKAMPFVEKWFPELSVRAGNILFRVRGIRTFGDFLRFDVGSRIGTEGETKVEIIFQVDNAVQIVTCYPISDSAANIEMNRQSWTRVGQP